MATKYFLPCDCGQSVAIEVSQAGQTVACDCGTVLDVPSMRSIRQLEQAEQVDDASSSGRRWSAVHGTVFAIGSLLIVCGLAIGVVSHVQYSFMKEHVPPTPTPEFTAEWVAEVDDWSATQAWQIWLELREERVPSVSIRVVAERSVGKVFERTMVAYGFAAGGALLAIGAMVLGAGRRKPGSR